MPLPCLGTVEMCLFHASLHRPRTSDIRAPHVTSPVGTFLIRRGSDHEKRCRPVLLPLFPLLVLPLQSALLQFAESSTQRSNVHSSLHCPPIDIRDFASPVHRSITLEKHLVEVR
ncbi:hypothetical protein NDU88_003975 [Pleurodeles waltl]|uniref:Uncharacterized protein n=1 Tax=Pleurodeles waltl TaxID=8319 RepID=A0AAV7UFV9_PLEWA|nr:hypothetical protein NDU88_003975 [Pleurodeles waltl]